jgi:hypothetical protein
MKPLKDSTLIICGIVRNAEIGLKKNIPVINALCNQSKDYKIVVYEKDSMYGTKEIFKKWAFERERDKIHVLLNDGVMASNAIPTYSSVSCNPFFSRKRIEKMANLRNQYTAYIREMQWEADYILVVDLDVDQLFLNGILSSFSSSIEWDAITAFGYSLSPLLKKRYHDTFALVEYGKEEEPQTEEKIVKTARKYGQLKYTDTPVRVFSAFGGLAIYRYEAFKDLDYQLIQNHDKRVEVYCEHYSIYRQMKKNGYDRVFINPSMYLKYQSISLSVIFGSVKKNIIFAIQKIMRKY